MKNTRKKLLVSSVAMLLVAVMALSTATFAWFTTSTTATTSNIRVKTIKSSELVISKSDIAWDTQLDYGLTAHKTLIPTSTVNGTAWFTASAESKTSFAKKSTDDFAAITTPANHYFTEMINVANAGAAAVKDVKITVSGINNNYVRFGYYETNEAGTTVGDLVVFDNAGKAYNAVKSATETEEITPSMTHEISVGEIAGVPANSPEGTVAGARYFKFFVWFEGQDEQCYDGTAGQEVGDITFSVSGTTVSDI